MNNSINTLSPNTITNSKAILGVQLVSREVTAISSRDGQTKENILAKQVVSEDGWSLNNMVERPSFKATYPWKTSSSRIIAKLRIPQDLLVSTINSSPFNNFVLARFDTEVTFQVTATPFHQGLLAAVFIPLTMSEYIESTMVDPFTPMSINQCVYLYANTNTVAQMVIPFNSPQSYINLLNLSDKNVINSLGYIYIINLNPIVLSGTAVDGASLSLFSRFVNCDFKVPRVTLNTAVSQGGTVSTINNNWSHVSDVSLPTNISGDHFDTKADVSVPMDKPTFTIYQPNVAIKSIGQMNHGTGPDYAEKLNLYPSAINECIPEHFASDQDEMSFDYLKKKYSYVKTITFSSSDPVGKALITLPLNPCPYFSRMLPGTQYPDANIPVPLLSYLTYPFNFWRGGMTYKIQVVATSFHTGKLFLCANYGTMTIPNNIISFTSQYGAAFEINQGSNEFEFTVPYVATTPYLIVPHGQIDDLANSMGTLSFVVMNPLVCPNQTPTSISINIFMAGAEDFDISILGLDCCLIPVGNYPKQARSQSNTTPQNPLNIETVETNLAEDNLIAPETSKPIKIYSHFGHRFDNLRTIAKKYQLVRTITFKNESDYIYTLPVMWVFNKLTTPSAASPKTGDPSAGLLSWSSSIFRMYRGQLRFKIVISGPSGWAGGNFNVYYSPSTPFHLTRYNEQYSATFNPDSGSYPAPLFGKQALAGTNFRIPLSVVTSPCSSAEVEIPFSTFYNSILLPTGPSENALLEDFGLSQIGNLIIQVMTPLPGGARMIIYAAIGDEARYGTLFTVPPILVNAIVDKDKKIISAVYPDEFQGRS